MAKQRWSNAGVEPGLWEVLSDPIVMSLMKADRITRRDVLMASARLIDQPTAALRDELRFSA